MERKSNSISLDAGLKTIADAVKSLSHKPGVYRMISSNGEVLYVGKAKSLKKRVSSYLNYTKLPARLQNMIMQTRNMEFITTHTEAEALLLESNLIKKLKPRYNILLRDDKSFPYILIRKDHDFPQILKHRGAKTADKGSYFGPFASAGDVNRTISILQRAFLLRNCSDHYFLQRQRPCLQYHIKRCTAPCVGLVSRQDYAKQVKGASDFMSGKSRDIQEQMTKLMLQASKNMDYETAASYRDRIRALASIHSHQDINIDIGDADIIGLYSEGGKSCIQVFFFRSGKNFGNYAYFPRHDPEEKAENILSAFIAQFYEGKSAPAQLIVSHDLPDKLLLEEALSSEKSSEKLSENFIYENGKYNQDHNSGTNRKAAQNKVVITHPIRGKRKRIIEFVCNNAADALRRHASSNLAQEKLLRGVAELFGMDELPQRIEVYDNSHISGTNMVGAMIVAGPEGFQKNAYRTFNIKQAAAADDYGMMREVLSRRFKSAIKEQDKEQDRGECQNWPDILLIDGGQGQYNACMEVLEEFGITDRLLLVAIAKGVDRNAGREKFFMKGREPFQLPPDDPVLHYLQRLRDEAHRFAIGTHRARRNKQITRSPLDEISGIGAKRKKALLMHFGSAKAVSAAAIEDLEKVEGISKSVAKKIYSFFHEQ